MRLRVLLIRKDFKRTFQFISGSYRLRVLLIRKDFKQRESLSIASSGLRVLLIRKDFKQWSNWLNPFTCLRVLLIRKDFKLSSVHMWLSHVWESWEGWVQQTAWVYDGIQRKKRCCLSFSIEKRVRPELRGCQIDVKKYARLYTDFISKTHSV